MVDMQCQRSILFSFLYILMVLLFALMAIAVAQDRGRKAIQEADSQSGRLAKRADDDTAAGKAQAYARWKEQVQQ
jgi:hypothetical protein